MRARLSRVDMSRRSLETDTMIRQIAQGQESDALVLVVFRALALNQHSGRKLEREVSC
jgi:hypothetical protein